MFRWIAARFGQKSAVERTNIEGEGYSTTVSYANDTTIRGVFPVYEGKVTPAVAAMIYSTSPYVNVATNVIADYISSVPLSVLMQSGRNAPKRIVTSGEPFSILQWINSHMTQSDFISTIVSWYVLTDNAYIAIEPIEYKDRKQAALQLFPLNPTALTLVPDPETHAKGYIYKINDKEIFIKEENMIHIKGFSPFRQWYGLSNLNSLVSDIEIERFAKKQAATFYEKAANISGVLKTNKDYDPEEIIKIKREMDSQYSGGRNAYRIMVLTEGMEFEPMKTFNIESSSVPVIEQTTKTHAMVMGVPIPLLLGDSDNLDAVEALFWNKTLIPICRKISAMLTKKLALPISKNLTIEFDFRGVEALRIQALNRARVDVAYMNTGKNTPNEIRAQHNEEPFTGDLEEFGNTPIIVWKTKQALIQQQQAAAMSNSTNGEPTGASPSLSMTGSEGGRDQSANGEAQLIDQTGTKDLGGLSLY